MNIFKPGKLKAMKRIIVILLPFVFFTASAQKGIDNLVQAEKNFAAHAVAHGTKEAFLKFMDSTAIVFENGQPVSALHLWQGKQDLPGILNWFPLSAGISGSGDLGYTSGPWFYKNRGNDSIVASGQFNSVWHLNKKGEWKFILDMGTNNVPLPNLTDTTVLKKRPVVDSKKGSTESLMETDSVFVASQHTSSDSSFRNFFSTVFLFNRSGQSPQESQWKDFPLKITYRTLGSGIASSKDFGFVYGTASIGNHSDNFLRIWRREGKSWKLLMEVLRIAP